MDILIPIVTTIRCITLRSLEYTTIGTKQGAIARLESMAYGKFSIATLHKVADFFDVAVWVEFVPFSTLLERTSDLSAEALTPANYSEEFGDDEQPDTPLR